MCNYYYEKHRAPSRVPRAGVYGGGAPDCGGVFPHPERSEGRKERLFRTWPPLYCLVRDSPLAPRARQKRCESGGQKEQGEGGKPCDSRSMGKRPHRSDGHWNAPAEKKWERSDNLCAERSESDVGACRMAHREFPGAGGRQAQRREATNWEDYQTGEPPTPNNDDDRLLGGVQAHEATVGATDPTQRTPIGAQACAAATRRSVARAPTGTGWGRRGEGGGKL